MNEYTAKLEDILFAILVGNSKRFEIQHITGLSDEECIEIEKVFNNIVKNIKKRKEK